MLFTKLCVRERRKDQNESLRHPSPAQPTGPARSHHFIATSPGLLKPPRPSLSSAWLLPSTKIVFTTVAPGTPWPPCPQAPAEATASPTDSGSLPKLQDSGHRQDRQSAHQGCSGLAGPLLEMHFFFPAACSDGDQQPANRYKHLPHLKSEANNRMETQVGDSSKPTGRAQGGTRGHRHHGASTRRTP